jgi:hypothetical protein
VLRAAPLTAAAAALDVALSPRPRERLVSLGVVSTTKAVRDPMRALISDSYRSLSRQPTGLGKECLAGRDAAGTV